MHDGGGGFSGGHDGGGHHHAGGGQHHHHHGDQPGSPDFVPGRRSGGSLMPGRFAAMVVVFFVLMVFLVLALHR